MDQQLPTSTSHLGLVVAAAKPKPQIGLPIFSQIQGRTTNNDMALPTMTWQNHIYPMLPIGDHRKQQFI